MFPLVHSSRTRRDLQLRYLCTCIHNFEKFSISAYRYSRVCHQVLLAIIANNFCLTRSTMFILAQSSCTCRDLQFRYLCTCIHNVEKFSISEYRYSWVFHQVSLAMIANNFRLTRCTMFPLVHTSSTCRDLQFRYICTCINNVEKFSISAYRYSWVFMKFLSQ